jgi:hypothetical protein
MAFAPLNIPEVMTGVVVAIPHYLPHAALSIRLFHVLLTFIEHAVSCGKTSPVSRVAKRYPPLAYANTPTLLSSL